MLQQQIESNSVQVNMYLVLVFVFLCVGESLTSETDLRCNNYNNEEASLVQPCPPERTCQNRKILYRCVADQKSVIQCRCKNGLFRNSVGNCITEEQCDRCDEDQNEYYSCGGFCDNVCSELSTQNQTNCPVVNIKCNEKCYCKDGYARNSQNICIPINECGMVECSICKDPNEVYSTCTQTCPPDLCFSIVAKFKCDSKTVCNPGCRCKSGYLRKEAGSCCMPIKQCPELANSPDFN